MSQITTTLNAKLLAEIHATSFADSWTEVFMGAMLVQPGVVALTLADQEAAGFILLRIVADEAEILTFAVRPEARNRGQGRTLLLAALAYARAENVVRCFLEVAIDNGPAISVYSKAGFVTCGRRKDYYQRDNKTVDAVIMEFQNR